MDTKLRRITPIFILIIINVIGFLTVYFQKTNEEQTVLYYSIALVGVLLVTYCIILFASMGDDVLFLTVAMLLSIGVIMLYRLGTAAAMRQIVWFYIGVGGYYLAYICFYFMRFWHKLKNLYIATAILLFVATMVLGSSLGGANNWIVIGDFSMQPSEIIKILYILALSAMYADGFRESQHRIGEFYNSRMGRDVVIACVAFVFMGFLVLQREWGSALLYFIILLMLQYVFGGTKTVSVGIVAIGTVGALLGAKYMTHIQTRIAIWLNPFESSGDMGYQIVQSLYAIASGGFMGSGLGLGVPHLIPVVHSDFIFPAICEEMGTLGGIAVILLFFVLAYRGIKISLTVNETFYKCVALGIAVMYAFQAFIIIGGTTKLIPLTGITLPFISAGGSSLLASFISLGVLQAISNLHSQN